MKKLATFAVIMLIAGIIGVFMTFNMQDLKTFGTEAVLVEKTIDAKDIQNIKVDSDSVNIEIKRSATNDIKVSIDGRASKKYVDRFELTAEAEGDTAKIHADYKDIFFVGFNYVDVDLVIELPDRLWDSIELDSKHSNIDIEHLTAKEAVITLGSGNIDTEELQAGIVKLTASHGNMDLENVTGDNVELQSSSGNIKLETYSVGQLKVNSDHGNVTIEDGVGAVQASTKSSNIRFNADELKENVSLTTNHGNIRLEVEKQPESAEIVLKHAHGNRDIDWKGIEASMDTEHAYSGNLGSGAIKIEAESETGNIKLGID
jgi:lia operon protein LiaG